jgi:hypothetical protein
MSFSIAFCLNNPGLPLKDQKCRDNSACPGLTTIEDVRAGKLAIKPATHGPRPKTTALTHLPTGREPVGGY